MLAGHGSHGVSGAQSDASDPSQNGPLTVASLWVGGDLGWLEHLCLKSFAHAGHPVVLYSYGAVGNVPEEVQTADARDIWTPPPDLLEATAPSYIADIFRVYLMEKTDFVWVDTDVICIAPLQKTETGFILGWAPWYGEINNAIMRMPASSDLFGEIKTFLEDMEIIPEWIRPRQQNRLRNTPVEDRLVARYHIRRTILGPACLTHLAQKHVRRRDILEPDILFPVPWQFSDVLFNPLAGTEAWITPDTKAVHLWSHMIKRHKQRKPYQSSFVGNWFTKLGLGDGFEIGEHPAIRSNHQFENV